MRKSTVNRNLLFLAIWLLGVGSGALGMYWATGFIGPPQFDDMRKMAAWIGAIPGLALVLLAINRYVADKYVSYTMRDALWWSMVLFVLLPLTMWLSYPYVHERIGLTQQSWQWVCSSRGCGWEDKTGSTTTSSTKNPGITVTPVPTTTIRKK